MRPREAVEMTASTPPGAMRRTCGASADAWSTMSCAPKRLAQADDSGRAAVAIIRTWGSVARAVKGRCQTDTSETRTCQVNEAQWALWDKIRAQLVHMKLDIKDFVHSDANKRAPVPVH